MGQFQWHKSQGNSKISVKTLFHISFVLGGIEKKFMDAVGLLKKFQNAAFNPNLEIYIVIALMVRNACYRYYIEIWNFY